MAKVLDPVASKLPGKAHGLVYVQLNGETYTRRLPRRKKDAWPPGMLLNLQRFKQVNSFCSRYKTTVIPQIWNGLDKTISGYALFLKSNMADFGVEGGIQDARKIRLSNGKLTFWQGFEVLRSEENENRVEVSWPREMAVGGAHLSDELMVISEADGQYSNITSTEITKEDLKGNFELPALPEQTTSGPIYLCLFFASRDHRKYSECVCFEVSQVFNAVRSQDADRFKQFGHCSFE